MSSETAVLFVEEALDLGDVDDVLMAINGYVWCRKQEERDDDGER